MSFSKSIKIDNIPPHSSDPDYGFYLAEANHYHREFNNYKIVIEPVTVRRTSYIQETFDMLLKTKNEEIVIAPIIKNIYNDLDLLTENTDVARFMKYYLNKTFVYIFLLNENKSSKKQAIGIIGLSKNNKYKDYIKLSPIYVNEPFRNKNFATFMLNFILNDVHLTTLYKDLKYILFDIVNGNEAAMNLFNKFDPQPVLSTYAIKF